MQKALVKYKVLQKAIHISNSVALCQKVICITCSFLSSWSFLILFIIA